MPRRGTRKENNDEGSDIEVSQTPCSRPDGIPEPGVEISVSMGEGDRLSKEVVSTQDATVQSALPTGPTVSIQENTQQPPQQAQQPPQPQQQQQHSNKGSSLTEQSNAPRDLTLAVETALENLNRMVCSSMKEVTTGLQRLQEANVRAPVTQAIDHFASTHPPPVHLGSGRNQSHIRGVSHRFRQSMTDTSSDEEDNESFSQSSISTSRVARSRSTPKFAKLPPFTGKESWRVWFNRFDEVASRQRWTEDNRLDELLPRLQGVAGEFVFDQLNRHTRGNYQTLVRELKSRFRKVETHKTFAAALSNRNQKSGETVEEYAAELKKLYSKAHPHRDGRTRQEDLLRRFFDGLIDEKIRVQVEYVNDPKNIDGAVDAVVAYMEACKPASSGLDRRQCPTRLVQMVAPAPDEDTEEGPEEHIPSHPTRITPQGAQRASNPTNSVPSYKSNQNGRGFGQLSDACVTEISKLREEITEKNHKMTDRLNQIEKSIQASAANAGNQSRPFRPRGGPRPQVAPQGKRLTCSEPGGATSTQLACWRCGQAGHFIRQCPYPMVMGQLQVSAQPAGMAAHRAFHAADSSAPLAAPAPSADLN